MPAARGTHGYARLLGWEHSRGKLAEECPHQLGRDSDEPLDSEGLLCTEQRWQPFNLKYKQNISAGSSFARLNSFIFRILTECSSHHFFCN